MHLIHTDLGYSHFAREEDDEERNNLVRKCRFLVVIAGVSIMAATDVTPRIYSPQSIQIVALTLPARNKINSALVEISRT